MPEIKQYNQQVAPSGPVNSQRATGEDFGEGVGQAVQGLGQSVSQLGQVVAQRQAQDDVSSLHAKVAQAKDQLHQQYEDQLQKGTLNHDDFMEDVNDTMDEIGQSVNTREGRERFNQLQADTKYEFSKDAQMGQAHLAGAQAVQDVRNANDARTSYVFGDPTKFQSTLKEQTQSVDDMVALHGLPADRAPELKRELMDKLAIGAIRGTMKMDPQQAREQLDSGQWDNYMGEGTKYKMDLEVTRAESGQRIDQERQEKLKQKAADAVQESTVQSYYTSWNDPKATPVTAQDILHDMQAGKIDASTFKAMTNQLKSNNEEKKLRSDPVVFNDLAHRLSLPDGDPKKITNAAEINKHIGEDLSVQDSSLLYGLLGERHTPQGEADSQLQKNYMETVKNQLIKNPLAPDPEGLKINQQVQAQSLEYSLKAAQNGKTKTQIWSPVIGGKPNPDYVGNHVAIPHRSIEDIINSTVERMSDTTPEGEELVKVISPAGVNGRVPKSKLEEKIKAGYKEAGK